MATKRDLDPEAEPRKPNYPIESVDNALRLLIMVAEQKQIRVSEASSELGIAISTAHRLLAMLSHHDFVVQDSESKVYKAGPVLLRIGLAAAKNHDVRAILHPFAEDLRDETGETVHVAVLQGNEVLFVDCVESPNALRVASRVGSRMYAHCTSIGKAWLAFESEDFIRGLYTSPRLPALTPSSITSRAALIKELAEVRGKGYSHNENESELGVGSVSSAVLDHGGKPLAAMSVSVPLVRMPANRWALLAEAVQRVCRSAQSAMP
ncbi:MAG TPA: IclR family transcriptional regulator [Acidimicrobiales bacterium]|nr:IclR family transcriptional regulator [Acidimicrobiales bacterium]